MAIQASAFCLALLLLPYCSAISLGFARTERQTQTKNESDCEDAAPDSNSRCYKAITWALETGLQAHPDWYPGLNLTDVFGLRTEEAKFKEVQGSLYRLGKAGCGKPCPVVFARPTASAPPPSRDAEKDLDAQISKLDAQIAQLSKPEVLDISKSLRAGLERKREELVAQQRAAKEAQIEQLSRAAADETPPAKNKNMANMSEGELAALSEDEFNERIAALVNGSERKSSTQLEARGAGDAVSAAPRPPRRRAPPRKGRGAAGDAAPPRGDAPAEKARGSAADEKAHRDEEAQRASSVQRADDEQNVTTSANEARAPVLAEEVAKAARTADTQAQRPDAQNATTPDASHFPASGAAEAQRADDEQNASTSVEEATAPVVAEKVSKATGTVDTQVQEVPLGEVVIVHAGSFKDEYLYATRYDDSHGSRFVHTWTNGWHGWHVGSLHADPQARWKISEVGENYVITHAGKFKGEYLYATQLNDSRGERYVHTWMNGSMLEDPQARWNISKVGGNYVISHGSFKDEYLYAAEHGDSHLRYSTYAAEQGDPQFLHWRVHMKKGGVPADDPQALWTITPVATEKEARGAGDAVSAAPPAEEAGGPAAQRPGAAGEAAPPRGDAPAEKARGSAADEKAQRDDETQRASSAQRADDEQNASTSAEEARAPVLAEEVTKAARTVDTQAQRPDAQNATTPDDDFYFPATGAAEAQRADDEQNASTSAEEMRPPVLADEVTKAASTVDTQAQLADAQNATTPSASHDLSWWIDDHFPATGAAEAQRADDEQNASTSAEEARTPVLADEVTKAASTVDTQAQLADAQNATTLNASDDPSSWIDFDFPATGAAEAEDDNYTHVQVQNSGVAHEADLPAAAANVTEESVAVAESQFSHDEQDAAAPAAKASAERPAAARGRWAVMWDRVRGALGMDTLQTTSAAPAVEEAPSAPTMDQKAEMEARIREKVMRDMGVEKVQTTSAAPPVEEAPAAPTVDQKAKMEARIREKVMRELGVEEVQTTSAAPLVEEAPAAPTVDQKAQMEARIREKVMRELGVGKVQTTSAAPSVEEAPAASTVDQKAQMEARIREKVMRELGVKQAQATTAAQLTAEV